MISRLKVLSLNMVTLTEALHNCRTKLCILHQSMSTGLFVSEFLYTGSTRSYCSFIRCWIGHHNLWFMGHSVRLQSSSAEIRDLLRLSHLHRIIWISFGSSASHFCASSLYLRRSWIPSISLRQAGVSASTLVPGAATSPVGSKTPKASAIRLWAPWAGPSGKYLTQSALFSSFWKF